MVFRSDSKQILEQYLKAEHNPREQKFRATTFCTMAPNRPHFRTSIAAFPSRTKNVFWVTCTKHLTVRTTGHSRTLGEHGSCFAPRIWTWLLIFGKSVEPTATFPATSSCLTFSYAITPRRINNAGDKMSLNKKKQESIMHFQPQSYKLPCKYVLFCD